MSDFEYDILSALVKNEKTIWDGLELLCSFVDEKEISHRQAGEILCCIVEKSRGSLASALKKVLDGTA